MEQLESRLLMAGLSQWADSVVGVTSEWSSTGWSASRALGAPDVFVYGDHANAWAPLAQNNTIEKITLGFDTPVYADGVTVRENWGNGFVTMVEVRNQSTGGYETVWSGTDPSLPGNPVDFLVSFTQRSYLVDAVRLTSDTNRSLATWEEIDAVALHGSVALDITRPTADLADPTAGASMVQSVLNSRAYIDVTFADTGGSGLNLATITDAASEFTLGGTATSGVTVNGAATLVSGSTYRYSFTGSFGLGAVSVSFATAAFADNAGNTNVADLESFTVQAESAPPTADLADPTDGATIVRTVLNGRGYVDVTFADKSGSGLNLSTITDSAQEFALSGAAASGVTLNGAALLVSGTTYRYSFTGTFGTGLVSLDFAAGTFADNAGRTNAAVSQGFFVEVGSQWASRVIDVSSQWGGYGWSAERALGQPDVFAYGDYSNAWAPVAQNGTTERITLGFETPVYADGVTIRETWGNGFVTRVEVRNQATGNYEMVWSGTDPSLPGSPVEFLVSFARRTYLVDAVRVFIDTNHSPSTWEEIDAVALHGRVNLDIAPPTADLASPRNGDTISQFLINSRRYIDVTFADTGGSGLNLSTITDAAPEFTLGGVASGAVVDGSAVLVSGNTYRYSFTGSIAAGTVTVNYAAGTFADWAGNANLATTQSFTVEAGSTPPLADLADPANGSSILQATLNTRQYIDVTFVDTAGSGLALSTITDSAQEFTLSGTAASGVTLNGAATLVSGTTYRYSFAGSFSKGTVTVDFVAGTFADNAGRTNLADAESFTVTRPNVPPTARDDEYSVSKDGVLLALETSPDSLLFNDSDPDGDSLIVSSVDITNPPSGPALKGMLTWTSGGAFLYDPRGKFDGLQNNYPDRFQYTISDGNGGTDTATVTIWVLPDGGGPRPSADLANPAAGAAIVRSTLNNRGYIDVTFRDNGGSGLNLSTIVDAASEFTLNGDAATGVAVNGAATLVSGSTYRYSFTGSFGLGAVTAVFAEGTFLDNAGRTNLADAESFTVQLEAAAPSADLADPANGAAIERTVLNGRGYVDVTFSDKSGSGLNLATITDSAQEFSLSGAAASGVTVNGAAVLVSGTTYRYSFTGSFAYGAVGVSFVAGSFADNAGTTNATESEQFFVELGSQWANRVIDVSSQWGGYGWSAARALGQPDVFAYGDYSNAWAPVAQNGTTERITLGFETPVYADGVTIRETWGNGFVTRVEVRNQATGDYETVWTGTDPSLPGSPVEFQVSFARRTYLVDAVRVTIDTNHSLGTWEEIDAVALRGRTTPP